MPSEKSREVKLNPRTVMVTAGIIMGLLLAGFTLNGLRKEPGQSKNSETAKNNTANSSSRKTSDNTNPETIDLQGSWDVVYKDRVLGSIKGRAVINSEQTSARVRLTHPQSGTDHILRSTSFTRNGDRLTIELQGPWPGAQGYNPKPLGENVPIGRGSPYQSNGTGKVEVSIGNTSSVITVGDHQPVEPETVNLSFTIGSESLSGTWQHAVNAETGRTPDGGGRLGDFSYVNDDTGQGIQSGPEFWVRPEPFIQMVIPVYDQMRRNEANQPSFPYPWNEKGALLSPNINRRTLFVVGTSLPTEIGEPVIIESQNERVEYRVIAKQNDFNDQTATAPVVEDAWERIEKKLRNGGLNPKAEAQLKKLKAMDGILISAKMERGAGWGSTGFTLNGAEAVWTLKYGDHIGDIVITRPITQAHTEAIDFAISPEKVFVEIRTQAELPDVDQIPLLIGINGEIQLFHQKAIKAGANGGLEFVDQKRELFAKRVPIPEAEQARVDSARKNGDSDAKVTHVFRSPPLALITAGEENLIPEVQGDQRLVMQAGDVLQAWLGKRYILTPTQPLAKANIVSTPIDIAPALARQAGAPAQDENMSWPGALRKAAQCTAFGSENLLNNVLKQAYKNQENADYQNLLTRRVYQITDWSWTEIPYAFFQKSGVSTAADKAAYYSGAYKLTRTVGLDLEWWFGRGDPDVSYSVNVLLSDHAAMLLMQDVFEELMAAQLASLKKINTNDQVWEFRQRISASISAHDDHPIGDIQIAAPNGDRTWFFATYNDDAMEKDYGLKGDALYFWQLQATRETLKKYIEAVEYALSSSRELGPCDVEGLLQLTAIGQENVRRYVLGRLVSSAPTADRPGNEWKADRVARSAVLGLSVLGGSVKAQDEMINLDRQLFSIATAVGSMGVGASASLIGYETLSLSSLLLAIDATEVAYDSWSNLDKFFADKRELKFAKGASIVSGPTRYQQALLKDTDWYLQVVTQLLSALDFSEVIVAGPKTIGKILSTQRGKDLVVGGAGVAGSTGRTLTSPGTSIPIVPSTPDVRQPYAVPPQTSPTTFDPEDFTQTRNIDDLTDTVRIDPEDLTRTRNPDDFTDTVRTDSEDFTRTRDTDDVTDTVNVDTEDLTGTRNVDTSDLTGTVSVDTPQSTPPLADVRRNLQKVESDARNAENEVRGLIKSNSLGDKSEYELAALKQKIVAGNVQRELDKSINDALSNGVSETQVSKVLNDYLGAGNSTSVKNRSGAIADINLASIKAQGYEILGDTDAEYLRAMLTRVQTNGGTSADVRTLRFFINEAEAQGGDFIGGLAKRGTFDRLDGYQPIASADEIKALQKFGQDNDLIPKNADTVNPGARIGDDPALTADDVRRLDPEQREDIFNAIVEAHRVRNAVGAKALEPAERAVLKLSDQLAVPSRGKLPDWASGLNDRTFKKISHMGARPDLKILVKKNPKAIAKIVDDPAALNVLESQPWDSLQELNAAITKDKTRIRDPVPGFYEGVKPKQGSQSIGGILVEDAIDDFTEYSATALPGTLQSETKAFVDGNAVATFTRDVKPIDIDGRAGVEMTMSYADGKNAPRFITDTDPPLIAGRGTPLATFMNVRAFHNLNIGYADPKLLRVKMSTVVNANTAVQIDWLKRMYGAENIQKYLKHTHSVKYAESALNQAGYKITKVEIPTARKNYKFQARRQVEGDFFHSKESPLDYLDRFGIDPDSKIESGFDIYIYVTPL